MRCAQVDAPAGIPPRHAPPVNTAYGRGIRHDSHSCLTDDPERKRLRPLYPGPALIRPDKGCPSEIGRSEAWPRPDPPRPDSEGFTPPRSERIKGKRSGNSYGYGSFNYICVAPRSDLQRAGGAWVQPCLLAQQHGCRRGGEGGDRSVRRDVDR